jgi:hypothetical protein
MFAKSIIKIGKRVGDKTQPCFNPSSWSNQSDSKSPFHTFFLVVSSISLLCHFSTTMQKGHLAHCRICLHVFQISK